MNFISKNLRKSRYFNLVLIIIALVLRIYNIVLFDSSFIGYLISIASILALISAFVYAIQGYKKDSAVNYKAFMFLTFATYLIDAGGEMLYLDDPAFNWSMLSTYANFARVIPMFLLTFIMNFGEKKSKICSYIVFALCLFIFVRTCIVYSTDFSYVTLTLTNFVNSAVAVVLVNEKYVDKASRGAK